MSCGQFLCVNCYCMQRSGFSPASAVRQDDLLAGPADISRRPSRIFKGASRRLYANRAFFGKLPLCRQRGHHFPRRKEEVPSPASEGTLFQQALTVRTHIRFMYIYHISPQNLRAAGTQSPWPEKFLPHPVFAFCVCPRQGVFSPAFALHLVVLPNMSP